MGNFLIVARTPRHDGAAALSADLAKLAQGAGHSLSELTPLAWLAVGGVQRPRLTTVGGWRLIGDVFNRRSPQLPASNAADPWDYERKMLARFWGRFVGVLFAPDHQPSAILRDPSGALECVVWRQDGLTLISSSAPDWLIRRLRPPWRINRRRLTQALRDPLSGAGPLLLDGPLVVNPGTLQPLPPEQPAVSLWRPSVIARRSLDFSLPAGEAAETLKAAIDESVAALGGLSAPIAAEVSGGLDSSIVASSLVRSVPDAVNLWINAYGAAAEADERAYVAALAETLGISPVSVPHAAGRVTENWLLETNQDFRPGLNALDTPHDRDWARRFAAAGVSAVMTGKGGDSILLQFATPDVFADLWLAQGWRALRWPDAARLAAANEVSVWTMAAKARRRRRERAPLPLRDGALLTSTDDHAPPHPWLTDCEAFGPAKTLQIMGVADSVSRHGPSVLTETVDVRHPLCAQPVIEAGLSIPTPLLTLGGRDRGLARQAFRDRLPAAIIERRSKGDMTQVYGRMIVDSLPFLRPWLMDGRLAALGVIDRDAADLELTRERFLWRGRYTAIMAAAAFEAWVRAWEPRLQPPPP